MSEIQFPITKLSYSSLTLLLRNPMIFKMREILGVYDQKMSVSGMIGRAGHEALKFYYGGNKEFPCPADPIEARALAKELGLKYLSEQPDEYINYGKTQSRETMLRGYTQAMDFFFAEEPHYHDVLVVEEKMEAELKTYEGEELPIPAVGVPDIVYKEKNGDIVIEDRKFTTAFTEYENEDGQPHEDYIKIIQAMFLNHLLIASKGIHAKRVDFLEIKRTANKDGSKQLRKWSVPLDHEPYRIIFYNLYKDVFKYLSSNPIFLPNLSDPIDGEHAGLIYAQGLINSDMSDVEVVHKVREVAFTTKKFVASRLDSAINRHLRPEERVKVKLAEFGIPVEPVEVVEGASVVQYRFKVSAGVRMATVKKHHDDIVKALEAKGNVRIIAPIPGTSLVGVEVESVERNAMKLTAKEYMPGTLTIPVGVEVDGKVVKVPLNEMPHLLVAGTTGSGKSTFLHATITALTEQMDPWNMELVLIDPKRVELAAFRKLPHLRGKVIYEYEDAVSMLSSLVDEMEKRYVLLEEAGKRDISEYNARRTKHKIPYIVVVIDEFADFMMRSRMEQKKAKRRKEVRPDKGKKYKELNGMSHKQYLAHEKKTFTAYQDDTDVELLIVRLAQMSRAVGIHLIIATQRPSADVISGLIRANFPTRIAFSTASAVESGVIGIPGAEKLAGKGDMLLSYPQLRGVVRLQGFVHKR